MKRPTTKRPGGLWFFTAPAARARVTPEVDMAQKWVTRWLNGSKTFDRAYRKREGYSAKSRARILQLLQLIKSAIEATQRDPSFDPNLHAQAMHVIADPFGVVDGPVWIDKFPAVSEAMQGYAIFPSLSFHHGPKRWHVVRELAPSNTLPAGETMAAHGLIELCRLGCLDNLRTCECGDWYFAKRSDGVACSESCRKRIHDQTEKAKEKRRERNRQNKLYKTGEIFTKDDPTDAKAAK